MARLIIIVVVLFGAFLVAAFALFQTFQAEENARSQSVRTSSSIENLLFAQIALTNAETGQRGYLLTQEESYLDSYHQGLAAFPKRISAVRSTLLLLPNAPQRLDDLLGLASERFAEMEATISLAQAGRRAEALQLVSTDRGQSIMADLRGRIEAIVTFEQALLSEANGRAARARIQTTLLMLCIGALTLVVFVVAYVGVRRASLAAALEEYSHRLEEAHERSRLLARELNHRVKNLFSIVMSIIKATARHETDAKIAASKSCARVQALAAAHALSADSDVAKPIDLKEMIGAIVGSQAPAPDRFQMSGPDITIVQTNVAPLGMILHELTTNALKYGAWADESGTLSINWHCETAQAAARLAIVWQEFVPSPVNGHTQQQGGASGFGSQLIDMSAAQLRADLVREWSATGLRVSLAMPLENMGPRPA